LAYGCAQSAYDPAPWDGDGELDEQEFPASVEDTDASMATSRSAAGPATATSPTTSSGEIETRASADAAADTKSIPEAGAASASGGRADAGSDAGSRDASVSARDAGVSARDAGDGTLDAGAGKSASPDAGAKTDAGRAPTTRDAGTGTGSTSTTCKENADCPSSKCGISAPFACCGNGKCGCSWFDLAYCQT
jgi:hypothetical protein